MHKLVYLCDWLPPDFGAVGQYSLLFARERAEAGQEVVLAGLSSGTDSVEVSRIGGGRLTVVRLHSATYDRRRLLRRAAWTLATNVRLIHRVFDHLCTADEILFTGSPPFLLHFLAPLNLLLPQRLVYRITDFYPECLMAAMDKVPVGLKWFYRLTVAWRRRVDRFEALGQDQCRLLEAIGIPRSRIVLKRDPSPVTIAAGTRPLACPRELDDLVVLLYSGNFGVAHDYETFVEGYRRHHREGSGRVGLWLNATGSHADLVEKALALPACRCTAVTRFRWTSCPTS